MNELLFKLIPKAEENTNIFNLYNETLILLSNTENSIPILRNNARRVWKKLGPFVLPDETEETVYWHVLDHGRKNGTWKPPLMIE